MGHRLGCLYRGSQKKTLVNAKGLIKRRFKKKISINIFQSCGTNETYALGRIKEIVMHVTSF